MKLTWHSKTGSGFTGSGFPASF